MKRFLMITVIATCVTVPAFAEQHATSNDDATTSQSVTSTGIMATNLIDTPVYMTKQTAEGHMNGEITEIPDEWQMVGEIEDFVVQDDGKILALLVDAGGFLGSDASERRIDIENVRFVRDADDDSRHYVVFNGDRSQFEQQQQYDEVAARREGGMRASEVDRLSTDLDQAPARREITIDVSGISTKELLGAPVYGSSGEWVGDLSELKVSDGNVVQSIIIDVGGFLGVGEKTIEFPVEDVELRRSGYAELRAYVPASEEELNDMEEWSGQRN